MLEHERIREEGCGCRIDIVTGIRTFICPVCAAKVLEPFATRWPRKDYLRSER